MSRPSGARQIAARGDSRCGRRSECRHDRRWPSTTAVCRTYNWRAIDQQRKIGAGRIQHQQAEDAQCDHGCDQDQIAAGSGRGHGVAGDGLSSPVYESSDTHFRKASPRSSKSLNSSKLVPPGESRTTSPACHTWTAAWTASSRPSQRSRVKGRLPLPELPSAAMRSFQPPRRKAPHGPRAGGPSPPVVPGQVLVPPAEQQDDRLIEGTDGSHGPFGSGGDGVVVPVGPVPVRGRIPGGEAHPGTPRAAVSMASRGRPAA